MTYMLPVILRSMQKYIYKNMKSGIACYYYIYSSLQAAPPALLSAAPGSLKALFTLAYSVFISCVVIMLMYHTFLNQIQYSICYTSLHDVCLLHPITHKDIDKWLNTCSLGSLLDCGSINAHHGFCVPGIVYVVSGVNSPKTSLFSIPGTELTLENIYLYWCTLFGSFTVRKKPPQTSAVIQMFSIYLSFHPHSSNSCDVGKIAPYDCLCILHKFWQTSTSCST